MDEALVAAGLDRRALYLTNAVKHFKFTPKGKTRLHAKPDYHEVRACRPWLAAEIEQESPRIVVALGATAAMLLLERRVSVSQSRGVWIEGPDRRVLITVHPAFVLRAHDRRDIEYRRFVADLAGAALA